MVIVIVVVKAAGGDFYSNFVNKQTQNLNDLLKFTWLQVLFPEFSQYYRCFSHAKIMNMTVLLRPSC